MQISIDREFVVRTLTDLVRINSMNPSLVPGAPGEAEVARYIAACLGGLGLETAIDEPRPGRATAICTLKGTGGGRSLMLNGHEDTVGVEGMAAPFAATIEDGRLYGRGAHDMKGSLASCIGAVKALADARVRLRGDVIVAAVADEEYESEGTSRLVERCRPDGAVVTEPTNLQVCLAHKGYAWIEVETIGRAAHGSRFTEGVDANIMMGRVLSELDRLEQGLRLGPAHRLVGPPSLHAATLNGGSGLSTYAATCVLRIERRTVPGETIPVAVSQVQAIVDRLRAADARFAANVRLLFAREPFEVSPDVAIVRVLVEAARQVLGEMPALVGDSPWMDPALLAEAGVETVVMGPIGGGEHSAVEWVDVDSVVRMAEILARTALAYCDEPRSDR